VKKHSLENFFVLDDPARVKSQHILFNRYIELFDKIDITKEGFVDWDMFIQFMLLEFYEKDEKIKTTQVNYRSS